jgi:DNA-binding transcriptional LysR family regulator
LTVAVSVLTPLVQQAAIHAETASVVTQRLPSMFAIRWMLPRLAEINNALPETELRVSTSADDTPDLTMPDVEAMVVGGTGQLAGMDAVPLFAEQLTPMCTTEMAASLSSATTLAILRYGRPCPLAR